ncbi:hypothetical protein BG015_010027 [Linnemannia schmuckeri]|uniref:Uncharacterized protein n=1 Tax=Linnemannia schmuckeri TaxID=64567 RepID=A0A9P5VES0_9FUNG|nr:hypothetical protein BG015_010027 [Linnemannia schmuckeri]
MYYFIRLCRTIAMYPKSDAEEALPAYQPLSTLPATGNFCYHEDDDEDNHYGHRPSGTSARPTSRDIFQELRRERVPTTVITTIPTAPSPAYLTLSRSSGYYHNGEMTQVGNPSSLPPGTFVIPLPAIPTRPSRSARRSAGLGVLAARLSGQTPLLPVVNSNALTGTEGSEPLPPSYLDVFGESNLQPSYQRMDGSQRIAHSATIV